MGQTSGNVHWNTQQRQRCRVGIATIEKMSTKYSPLEVLMSLNEIVKALFEKMFDWFGIERGNDGIPYEWLKILSFLPLFLFANYGMSRTVYHKMTVVSVLRQNAKQSNWTTLLLFEWGWKNHIVPAPRNFQKGALQKDRLGDRINILPTNRNTVLQHYQSWSFLIGFVQVHNTKHFIAGHLFYLIFVYNHVMKFCAWDTRYWEFLKNFSRTLLSEDSIPRVILTFK